GRAAVIASGLKCVRPDLSVWLVTGDGDSLSIGGNHTIHLLRRNIDINVLMFNNEIYGLTKGQYSPTSAFHKVTKTSPYGSIDYPFNTAALALGARASFFARSMDRDPKHLQQMMIKAHQHQGTSFLEIYQNCVIFNDKTFDLFTEKGSKPDHTIFVEEGKPLTFGENHEKGIILDGNTPKVVNLEQDNISVNDLWIHNSQDYHKAQALASFADSIEMPRPFGIFYDVQRPVYNELMQEQINELIKSKGAMTPEEVLAGYETWEIK
ncbi:MAG: thiamine pyrophosphate-dependent enzyme, partial [Chitinophagaceae bacterium]